MRVCLINPPWSVPRRPYAASPPLAVLSVGTALEAAGVQVSVLDLQRQLELGGLPPDSSLFHHSVQLISGESPDLVGFTAYTKSAPVAIRLAQVYKKEAGPEAAPVVMGGPFFHWVAREVMDAFSEIDFIVRGEGERTICDLASGLTEGRRNWDTPGLVWRREDGATQANPDRPPVPDLNSIPFPDFGLIDPADYFLTDNLSIVDVGRGCFNRCGFCQISRFWGNGSPGYRKRRPEEVVAHMQDVFDRWGVRRFIFAQDSFVDGKEGMESLRDAVNGSRLEGNIQISLTGVLSRLDTHIIRVLSEIGCTQIFIGVESGSDTMLLKMGKQVDLDRLPDVVHECRRWGIEPALSYVVGSPGETLADLEKTLSLAKDLNARGAKTHFGLYSPSPGTPMYEECRGQLEYTRLFPAGTNLQEEFDVEDLVVDHPEIFPQYYNIRQSTPATLPFAVMLFYSKLLEEYPRTFGGLCQLAEDRPLKALLPFLEHLGSSAPWEEWVHGLEKSRAREQLHLHFPSYVRGLGLPQLTALVESEAGFARRA